MKASIRGPVRVRFPPSPTGFLHVGGARTAIYNDLLRRRLGGAFVLRIEDTDRQRSTQEATDQIQSALRWLGLVWDEGPFLQSERFDRHREVAHKLLAEDKAYHDFVTPEQLDAARQEIEKKGGALRYRDVFPVASPAEIERRLATGEPYAIRFRMPATKVAFHDLVRGDVEFSADVLDDFIILRSDGTPTYHLSVCCDDADMGITHILRGDDHLSNTPKHVALFTAMGVPLPVFGHLPLILGTDKKRLSKRTGATSVEEFRDLGILPQALYNYLALLGWSPGDGREILSREEMVEVFSVDRIVASAAVFDPEKLGWMNARYMAEQPFEVLLPHLEPFLVAQGLAGADPARLRETVGLHQSRTRTLADLAVAIVPYFRDRLEYDTEACRKFLAEAGLPAQLEALAARLQALERFDAETTEAALRGLAEELGIKPGVLIHPTRMALSGEKAGPPLFDLVAVMGQEAARRHLRNFLDFLASTQPLGQG